MKYFKIDNYINEEGESITSYTSNDGSETMYSTEAQLMMKDPSTGKVVPMPPIPVRINGADSIEEAFTKRDSAVMEVKKALEDEAKKPRIVTPGDLQGRAGNTSLKLV